MPIYVTNSELYHYGVLGMKWGHRKARKEAYKSARRSAYNKYQRGIDDAIERDEGRLKGVRKSNKQMRSEIKTAKKQYKQDLKTAKSAYETQKKRDKKAVKEAKWKYHMKTALTSDQKKVRAGAVIVASLLTSPVGGLAVAYGTTGYMRAKNDLARQNKGKTKVTEILERL